MVAAEKQASQSLAASSRNPASEPASSPLVVTTSSSRLTTFLQEAQVALLEKTKDRHDTYASSIPPARPSFSAQSEAKTAVTPPQESSGDSSPGSPAVRPPTRISCPSIQFGPDAGNVVHRGRSEYSNDNYVKSRCLSMDDPDYCKRHEKLMRNMGRSFAWADRGMAYMGIDWYTITTKKRFSLLFIFENLYYWCFAAYISTVIAIGAVLLYMCETEDGELTLPLALYTSAACVSQSGLAVVDWSKQSDSTYVISLVLIVLGSAPLLHCVPVILRACNFHRQASLTKALRRRAEQTTCDNQLTPKERLPKSRSDPCIMPEEGGHGSEQQHQPRRPESELLVKLAPAPSFSPLPLQRVKEAQNRSSASSVDGDADLECSRGGSLAVSTKSSFRSTAEKTPKQQREEAARSRESPCRDRVEEKKPTWLRRMAPVPRCSNALSEAHRLEYKALMKILQVMFFYWLTVHIVGIAVFVAYFSMLKGPIQETFREEGLTPWGHAIYLTVSAFQNNGLCMTPSSVMDFARSPALLNTIGLLIILGNTGLPIVIRLVFTVLYRHSTPNSERRRVLSFILEHPRRCFTHMFPAVHTMWLLLVVLTLNVVSTVVLLWQDHHSPAFELLSARDKFWNALFQSVSARTAGLNSVNIAFLSQGSTFFIAVMMYLATTPTVVTMRFSALAGGSELDITGRVEGLEEEVLKGDDSLKTQARRYLTQDITYLIIIMFFICCMEKKKFERSVRDAAPDSDGIYGDFTFFKVLFEVISAHGTCGFSLGYQNQTASFSSVWCTNSQMLLVFVMVLGRLRGLPDSIDPSVRVAMVHNNQNQETAHRFVHA